ncbi:MAG: peptidylprolyl isomerase [Bacteroidetes bacterium]|nr:peptidylprolyl isomerase [Bacteroidota bacterium]
MSQVKEKDTVQVHYKGTLGNGEVFDNSFDREPLEFTLGSGQIIPGFEQGVLNMSVNEQKTIHIPAEEAYGPVLEELIQEVPKADIPAEIELAVGLPLVSRAPDGREFQLVVKEVKEETVLLDANHPLAGKDLTFELELVAIK